MISGFVGTNKPRGVSSAKVVAKIKHLLKDNNIITKVGHMGTLDVDAEGVLVIAIGKATRLFDYYLEKQKTYVSTFKFGIKTTTDDTTGEVLETSKKVPTDVEFKTAMEIIKNQTQQIPPQFCANVVNGVKAYDLARQGKQIELKPKNVKIFDLDLVEKMLNDEYKFLITCSSGTYIRAICRDLCAICGTFGATSSIIRVKSGSFLIENCLEFETISIESLKNSIKNVFEILENIKQIEIDNEKIEKLKNGIKQKINMQDGTYFANKKMLIKIEDDEAKQILNLEDDNG